MNYRIYAKMVGVSEATLSRAMNTEKGAMKVSLAQTLSEGGFLTPFQWRHTTPYQRRKLWNTFVKEQEDNQLRQASK